MSTLNPLPRKKEKDLIFKSSPLRESYGLQQNCTSHHANSVVFYGGKYIKEEKNEALSLHPLSIGSLNHKQILGCFVPFNLGGIFIPHGGTDLYPKAKCHYITSFLKI